MTRNWFILLASLAFMACSSVQIAPLDDAYYYPDGQEAVAEETPMESPAQAVEYVNVQDTTVTIRIKR